MSCAHVFTNFQKISLQFIALTERLGRLGRQLLERQAARPLQEKLAHLQRLRDGQNSEDMDDVEGQNGR